MMPLNVVAAHPKKQNSIRVTNAVIPTKKSVAFFLLPLYTSAAYRLRTTAISTAVISSTKPLMRTNEFSVSFGISYGIIGRIIKCIQCAPFTVK